MATLTLKSLKAEHDALVALVNEQSLVIEELKAQLAALAAGRPQRPAHKENDLSEELPILGDPFRGAQCPHCVRPVRLTKEGRCEPCSNRVRRERWLASLQAQGKLRLPETTAPAPAPVAQSA